MVSVVIRDAVQSSGKAARLEDLSKVTPQNFTISKEAITSIRSNMEHLFVGPMTEAIHQTVGEPLMESASLIQKTTQIQSIFQQGHVRPACRGDVGREEQGQSTGSPGWAFPEGKERHPEAGTQGVSSDHHRPAVVFVAGSQSTDSNTREFGRSLTDSFRTDGYVYGPQDSGVAGIPFMVIGTGDGQMMQTLSTMRGAPQNSLKIFDGVNFALDTLQSDSTKANQAVHDAWQGNPLQAVSAMFEQIHGEL